MAIFNSFLYVYQRLVLDPHNNNKWHVVFVFRVPRFPTNTAIDSTRPKKDQRHPWNKTSPNRLFFFGIRLRIRWKGFILSNTVSMYVYIYIFIHMICIYICIYIYVYIYICIYTYIIIYFIGLSGTCLITVYNKTRLTSGFMLDISN